MDSSQNLNQLIALFLAESIRSRRTSLVRAAEISHSVIERLPYVKSEEQALAMLTDIQQDFEEVAVLKQALHFGYHPNDIKVYEAEIKEYASKLLAKDIGAFNIFLQDASRTGMTIQQLCLKYPQFSEYLMTVPDKGQVLAQIQPV